MKEMTCSDIQQVSLQILQDIHSFCVQQNITYSLDSGTLLGAIRHNGFIPWDDDIDIVMPRPDYEKFCKLYESKEGYQLVCRQKHNSLIPFARVCEMKRTLVDSSQYPWAKEKTGVWIDIFPLDGVADTLEQAKEKVLYLRKIEKKLCLMRGSKVGFKDAKGLLGLLKLCIKKMFFANESLLDRYISLMKEKDFQKSNYYCDLASLEYGIRQIHRREHFDKVSMHRFEDREFFIIDDYDAVLTEEFGNYMQLPPVEDRVCKHIQNKYYWK